jgi:quercetin dioxygenase-like cupin family protein
LSGDREAVVATRPLLFARSNTLPSVQQWNLLEIDAPKGMRDPVVVHQDEGARAVLVVLQPGQELGEHQVKENAWVCIIDGLVEVASGAETAVVGAGSLLRFEPGERHSLSARTGARILMILTPWPGEGHYPPG